MNDERRLKDLRAAARASYYCCRREIALVSDARLRAVLEDGAQVRWRLARSIDAFLVSQPAPQRSRLDPTLRDFAACLALQARASLASDPDLQGLRWFAADSAQLRHAVEICRALTWSLQISDLLTAGRSELKQVQNAVAGLVATVPGGLRKSAPLRTHATA
jgi:hypothetical protein